MFVRSATKQIRNGGPQRADAAVLRAHNTAVVLQLAWEAGDISRAELARRSGLARSTVSGIVGGLVELQLLRESHVARSRGGRPPIVLRFDDDRYALLGVDFGATHVAVALTNLRGRVLAWRSREQAVQEDPRGTLEGAHELIQEVLAQGAVDLEDVVGIGLGVPSPVDLQDPDRLSERILPAWEGIRPGRWLEERVGRPVFVENDANLCALAESWFGAGRDLDSLAFIELGLGVGGGLVVDKEIFRGAHGFAGEIGHTAIDSRGPLCACGLHGCLQAMIGSEATLARVRARLAAGEASTLTGSGALSLSAVADAALEGDAVALDAVTEVGRYLGIAVANLFNLVNPALVVLGGRFTVAGDLLLEPLRDAIRARALWASVAQADVLVSELGEQTTALGAATLVLRAALADPTMFPNRLRAITAGQPI